jgi:hypothetical protein
MDDPATYPAAIIRIFPAVKMHLIFSNSRYNPTRVASLLSSACRARRTLIDWRVPSRIRRRTVDDAWPDRKVLYLLPMASLDGNDKMRTVYLDSPLMVAVRVLAVTLRPLRLD